MKTSNLLKATAVVLGLLVTNCTGFRSTVKINHTNFGDEIDQSQNLIFTFNKDLVTDSLLEKWDTTTYITFTPAMPGKFKWTGKNELTFSPLQQWAPSTDYKAVITDKIAGKSKHWWRVDKDITYSFHTPYLKLLNTQVYWAVSDKHPGQVEIRMNLNFNYRVKPTDLGSLLHVYVKGTESSFEFNTLTPEATICVALPVSDLENEETATPMKVLIEKGFRCIGSKWVSKNPQELAATIPTRQKLTVMEMLASFADGEGIINVRLNQPVVNDNLKDLVKVNTTIPYTIEALDGGLFIKGAFQGGQSYNVTLNAKLKGVFGNVLGEEYSQYVLFGQMDPVLTFANDKSVYLTPAGAKNIALNVMGIENLKVSIIRIYENNIVEFMRSSTYRRNYNGEGYYNRHYDYYNGYYGRYDDEDEDADNDSENSEVDGDNDNGYTSGYGDLYRTNFEQYGDQVSEKTIAVKGLQRTGNSTLLHLDLEDMGYTSSYKGIYIIQIQDADKQYLQVSKFISFSDIGIIAKKTDNDLLIFANSIKTTEPIANAKINFISTNNQKATTVTTDNNGFAKIEDLKSLKPFTLEMITAQNGDDFNFMVMRNTMVGTSRFDVGGKKLTKDDYDCFIYGERDIYRPGDTINVNAVIRSMDWQTLKDVPIKFKLLAPNGKEYKSVKQTLDGQGSSVAAFSLPMSVMTGLYTIEVYTGNDVLLNYSKVSVEEFMPDRIKVTAKLSKTDVKPADTLTASIVASNLFGPPAANRKYEVTLDLKRKNFTSKKYANYRFNIHMSDNVSLETVVRDGETDEKGTAHELFNIPASVDLGILEGKVLATVFDESGRPVNRLSTFNVYTQDVFYGIRYMDEWVDTHHALSIPLIGMDKDGNQVASTAEVQVIRYNWETVIARDGGSYHYTSQKREQVLYDEALDIPVAGRVFKYTPLVSGDYEVRIKRKGAQNYVGEQFWAYGWGDTQNTSFQVSNEGQVNITMDKDKYNIGENANLLFNSPFEGKILVTVERDKVYSYYYLKTDKKAASLSIPVTEEYMPNVYVTATAIRELKDNSLPLIVARNFVPLIVENKVNKIPVVITAVEKSRSKTRQTISVKAVPNAELTIAVVDEGILQLKGFQTPDPYSYFYAKRSLAVEDYDLYPFIFPEIPYKKSSTGGDMEDKAKRVNPVTSKRVKLVTFWSGILRTNANGDANFSVNIPQFSGELRIMAVVYKDKAFGSAEKKMKVADPIVISTSLPRFLTPDDTMAIPVTITNTTDKPATITANINITGPLTLKGGANQSVTIKANTEQKIFYHVVVAKNIGPASVTVTVNGMNEKFIDKTDIGVRPASPLQKITDAGSIKGGQSVTLNLGADFIPAGSGGKLVVSRSPIVQFSKDLSYLIQYPYGCVEQTTSHAFPQIYYADMAKSLGQDKNGINYNPRYNVQEAINKLESMQLENGSLTYWQGEEQECWWGSVYAAHFLFEAKHAGYDVDQAMLNRLYEYMQYKMKSFDTEKYWYYDAYGNLESKTVASHEILYSMYVLGLAGKFDYTAMNYYKSNSTILSLDCKYLLACTYALAGNQINYQALLPKVYDGEFSKRCFYGSFYSGIRDEALALNALLEVDPDNAQVGLMAKHLSETMKKQNWMNTQEESFSFLALGKMAHRVGLSNTTATVSVNGTVLGKYTDKDLVIKSGVFNKSVVIKAEGTGNLFYFWELEGINDKGLYNAEDKFMMVRKTFFDRFGKSIDVSTVKQNDLIVVKLTAQTLYYDTYVQNVAITDLLPAGFEIENPRVGAAPELDWIKNNATPDYLDIRDDRINLFATVGYQPECFYYMVRAVSKGRFIMGPVSADAMYDDEYHSINGSQIVTVK